MNEREQFEAAAGKYASRTEFGEVIFPEVNWQDFVAALTTPQADKVPAAERASDDQLTGAYWQGWCEASDWAGRSDLYADRDSKAYADAMLRRLGPIRGTTTQPAKLPQEAQQLGVRITREALEQEYQRGFKDGAGLYRDNAVKAIKEPQPARAGAVSADLYLKLTDAMGYDSGRDGIEYSPEEWAAELLKDALAHRAGAVELTDAERWMLNFLFSQMSDLNDADWREHGFRRATFDRLQSKMHAATTAATGWKDGE